MHDLTIFFGDIHEYLGDRAKLHDPDAWMLDQQSLASLQSERSLGPVTVYTSLGDMPKNLAVVMETLSSADKIYYCPPPGDWSDGKKIDITDPGSSIQGLSESLLLSLPDHIKVYTNEPLLSIKHDPIPIVASRQCPDTQLWIVGCSVSHGVGIEEHERYGALLAQQLGLSCSFLTRPGSSIEWAADQIVRSDISEGDTVVWGLTNWSRMSYVHDHVQLSGIGGNTFLTHPEYINIVTPDQLSDHQNFYTQYYSVQRVISHCKKIKAKLLLVGIHPDNYSLLGYYKSLENYLHIYYKQSWKNRHLSSEYIDLGTDNQHPGPKQHQQYSTAILSRLNQSN